MASHQQPSLTLLVQGAIAALRQGQLPQKTLLTALLSKLLGFVLIAGGSVVKLPQISALLRSRSAAGLSGLAFELENLALSIHASYGFLLGLPINAYGEAAIMLVQNTLLLALMYKFARTGWPRIVSVLLVNGGLLFNVFTGRVSQSTIRTAYDLNNLIVLASRVPQIVKNHQEKDTGQLSIVTFVANVLGCTARIFTSIQDHAGMAMVRGYILGLVLNLIIAAQIILYGRAKRKVKKQGKDE